MKAPTRLRILVVDDDADTVANLRDIFELDGYEVETVGTIAGALDRDDWDTLFAIILDRRLPDGTAESVLPRLKRLAPQAEVVIVTGYQDLEGAISAIREGAADYLIKPVNADVIRSQLTRLAERRRAAHEIVRLNTDLQHRVTELQTLLDVIPIGIAMSRDVGCSDIRVNPAFARLLRIPPEANASAGAPPGERPAVKILRGGRELKAAEMPMQQAARTGLEVRDVEIDLVHPDGTVINLYGSAAPLLDEQGRPRGAVGAFVDITERRLAQERLLQAERLAAIGQMMTGLAHESGNALARSQACLEMLAWEVQDRPDALDLITRIQRAQDHLKQLYEEVRGYAAPLKLQRERCSVTAVCRQAWEHLGVQRQGRNASLVEEADGVDLECPVDPFRIEQVFRNILENALAACADPVRIRVRAHEAEIHGRPALEVCVQDNGPGLGPEQRQRIFEPFFTTKTKGTGLGMAIAKRILEAHGGRIAVGPANGGGAEIVLTLPRNPP
jgi:signal transduction histidine kinase